MEIGKDLRVVAGDKLGAASIETRSVINKAATWTSDGASQASRSLGSWLGAASRSRNRSAHPMKQQEALPAFQPKPIIFSSGRAGTAKMRSHSTRQHHEYPALQQERYIAAEEDKNNSQSTRVKDQDDDSFHTTEGNSGSIEEEVGL